MPTRPAALALAAAIALVLVGCSTRGDPGTAISELEGFDPIEFTATISAGSRPAVVNVWASWCIPCRSETPLLAAAHDQFGDRVSFIGVAIQDTATDAAGFVAEFEIPYANYLDPQAEVRSVLEGTGVPITYFVASDGEVLSTHFGVIDEGQLALGIDELLQREG